MCEDCDLLPLLIMCTSALQVEVSPLLSISLPPFSESDAERIQSTFILTGWGPSLCMEVCLILQSFNAGNARAAVLQTGKG